MALDVEWSPKARRDSKRVSADDQSLIVDAINRFASTGEGDASFLRSAKDGLRRLRVGDWRVFFRSDGRTMAIRRVLNRRDSYSKKSGIRQGAELGDGPSAEGIDEEGTTMIDIRKELHDEVDLMSEYEMVKLKELLDTFPSKPHVACRRAPLDDEPITEEEQAALDESYEDIKHGRLIPHEELMRELGLKKARHGTETGNDPNAEGISKEE